MQKKSKRIFILIVTKFIVVSFIIGNTIAWFSGAKPIHFPILPFAPSDQAIVVELENMPAHQITSEDAQSLSMYYFLHNHINQAHQVIQAALAKDENNEPLQALNAAIDVKRAGQKLDLLMGQVKLYQLRTALSTLKRVSDDLPDQFDTQLLALWAFASVPDINDSAQNAVVIAKRIEPILHADGAIPEQLSASSWLALARLYLHMADAADGTPAALDWQRQAREAWQRYQQLNVRPVWLEQERAVVAQIIAGLPDATT